MAKSVTIAFSGRDDLLYRTLGQWGSGGLDDGDIYGDLSQELFLVGAGFMSLLVDG